MQDFAEQMVATNGIRLRTIVVGDGPLVLMVHGWPELWYSWRHQMRTLADAGYRVAAPDVRGYGGSDKPPAVADYRMSLITADMAGLVETLSDDGTAVIVGHDWGAPIAWTTTLLYPDQIRAVIALSVPWGGRGEIPPLQLWKQLYTDRGRFFYQVYFQQPGVAEAELEADMRGTLRKIYFAGSGEGIGNLPEEATHKGVDDTYLKGLPDPDSLPTWLSEADLDYFVAAFESSGMRGPLNRYRCQDMDWEELPQLSDMKIAQPACFIAGTKEPVLSFVPDVDMVENMRKRVPNLQQVRLIEGGGHWIQQEYPQEVSTAMLEFLRDL